MKQPRDGRDGLDGYSAFEIARRHGFVGTEAEWLASLRGEPGEKGDAPAPEAIAEALLRLPSFVDAVRGKDGRDGKDGQNGKRGERGLDGKSSETLPAGEAFATFDFDESGAIVSMYVARLDGLGQARIVVPVRDADGVMVGAEINLA